MLKLTNKNQISFTLSLGLVLIIALASLLALFLTGPKLLAVTAVLACVSLVFSISCVVWFSTRNGFYYDIGVIYAAIVMLYTIIPGYILLVNDLSLPFTFHRSFDYTVLPDPGESIMQLWRQNMYLAAFVVSYISIACQSRQYCSNQNLLNLKMGSRSALLSWCAIIVFSEVWMFQNSSAVGSYVDHYLRFDHLSGISSWVGKLLSILKTGAVLVLMTGLYSNYQRYSLYAIGFPIIYASYRVYDSLGARIEAFTIVLLALILYQICVKPLTIRNALALVVF